VENAARWKIQPGGKYSQVENASRHRLHNARNAARNTAGWASCSKEENAARNIAN
jgi:hypothetical protein